MFKLKKLTKIRLKKILLNKMKVVLKRQKTKSMIQKTLTQTIQSIS